MNALNALCTLYALEFYASWSKPNANWSKKKKKRVAQAQIYLLCMHQFRACNLMQLQNIQCICWRRIKKLFNAGHFCGRNHCNILVRPKQSAQHICAADMWLVPQVRLQLPHSYLHSQILKSRQGYLVPISAFSSKPGKFKSLALLSKEFYCCLFSIWQCHD